MQHMKGPKDINKVILEEKTKKNVYYFKYDFKHFTITFT